MFCQLLIVINALFVVVSLGTPYQVGVWQVFTMTMIDTLYVRKSHRQRGIATRMLDLVMSTYPSDDIGFSDPLSTTMLTCKFILFPPHRRLCNLNTTIPVQHRCTCTFIYRNQMSPYLHSV